MEYKRLVTFLGDKTAPGTIRVILPYMLLNTYSDILANYDFTIHKTPTFYQNINVLQFQRACTPDQFELIKYIKSMNNPFKLFYDIDDLILDVPEYNVSSNYYHIHKDNIRKLLETFNCIVCSTPELAKHMSKYNKTTIIKNRLIKSLWETTPRTTYTPQTYKQKIIWAGGGQHFSTKNLDGDFSEDIIDFIKKTIDVYEWIFIGSWPLQLENNLYITKYPWQNYLEYPRLLKTIDADIGIALLKDNEFNKCKSNIKALEYTALGIPGIYSNIAPYKNMSCKVNNIDDFVGYIEKLTTDYDYRQKIKMKDYETLKDNLYWDETYIKRYIRTYLGK